MTAILGADGKLALSDDIRKKGVLKEGTRFDVHLSSGGEIILKPERKHRMTLLEHFRGMEGLELKPNEELLGDPIQL